MALLRQNPRVPRSTIHNLIIQQHLNKPVVVRYFYWLHDVFAHKFGNSLVTLQPIWPQMTRTMGHTLQFIIISEVLALILGVAVGIYSAIRQYSVFDYTFTWDRLPRLRDADLLARAPAAGELHRHLQQVERPDLLHLRPEQHSGWADVVAGTGCSILRCRS